MTPSAFSEKDNSLGVRKNTISIWKGYAIAGPKTLSVSIMKSITVHTFVLLNKTFLKPVSMVRLRLPASDAQCTFTD